MTTLYKLLKSSKTRTGNNSEKCSEEEIEKVLKMADDIRFTNPDLEKQREYLEKIKEWKNRVSMLLEDSRTEKTSEIINGLLKETREFKFTVKQISDLEAMAASYKWENAVNKELNGQKLTTIENLQELIEEGKAHSYDIGKIQKMESLLQNANEIKNELQKINQNETINNIDHLEQLNEKVEKLKVDLKEKIPFFKMLTEVRAWRDKCKNLLSTQCKVDQYELIKNESQQLKCTCTEFIQLSENMQPVLQWLSNANKFISKFGPLPAPSKGTHKLENIMFEVKKKPNLNKNLQELLESVSEIGKDTEEYRKLVKMKQDSELWEQDVDMQIVNYTKNCQVNLDEIKRLLEKSFEHPFNKIKGNQLIDICEHNPWITRTKEILQNKYPVHILETAFREGNAFSISTPEIQQLLKDLEQKISAARRWSAQYKQLRSDLETTKQKMNLEDLENILREGEKINVKVREIEWLSEAYEEIKQMQQEAKNILQSDNITFTVLEQLIKKIDSYEISIPEIVLLKALYDVCLVWRKIALQVIRSRQALSLSLLNSLPSSSTPSLSAKPKPESNGLKKIFHVTQYPEGDKNEEVSIIVQKMIINERELFQLNDIKILSKSIALKPDYQAENNFENSDSGKPKYCVCRRDESPEMVACDICSEWFHPACINLPFEIASKMPQFICPACVRRYKKSLVYKDSLDTIPRISEPEFNKLLDEGYKIPIQFMELKLLEEIKIRIENWKYKVANSISKGLMKSLIFEEANLKPSKQKKTELHKNDETLMKLYLEGLNYPVEFDIMDKIIDLLRARDWIRNVIKYKQNPKQDKKKFCEIFEDSQEIIKNYPECAQIYHDIISPTKTMAHSDFNNGFQTQNPININVDEDEDEKYIQNQNVKIMEPIKTAVNLEQIAIELQNMLKSGKGHERDIFMAHEELSGNPKIKIDLLSRARTVLNNAERFRNQAREMYQRNPNDPDNIELICKMSLNVGCIPESVFLKFLIEIK